MIALTRYPSASWASDNVELSNIARLGFTIRRQARQTARPNRVHNSYGLVILLQLLPTPPHDDAVTFRYRPESVYLKRTHTSLIKQTCKRTLPPLRGPVCKQTRPPGVRAERTMAQESRIGWTDHTQNFWGGATRSVRNAAFVTSRGSCAAGWHRLLATCAA